MKNEQSTTNQVILQCLDQIEATPLLTKTSNLFHDIITDKLGFRYKQSTSNFYKSPQGKVIIEETDDKLGLLISTTREKHKYSNIHENLLFNECYTCIEKLVFKEEWYPRLLKWDSVLLEKKPKSMVALFRRAMSTYNNGELVDGFGERKSIRYRTFEPNALMRDNTIIRFVSGKEFLNKMNRNDCRVYIALEKGDGTDKKKSIGYYTFGKDLAAIYGQTFEKNTQWIEVSTRMGKCGFVVEVFGLDDMNNINKPTIYKNIIDGLKYNIVITHDQLISGHFTIKYIANLIIGK